MTDSKLRADRRKALQEIASAGAIAGMLPLLGRLMDEQSSMSLFPKAFAQGINTGVRSGQERTVFVSGAQTEAIAMAEWEPANADRGSEIGGLRIAHGNGPVGKAPTDASRYSAKAFEFPGGTLRLLTWKKGGPVMHQITYETEIMVLEGSVTLTPARGIPGPTVTLRRGDALSFPSGVLRNMKPTGDTVLLQAFVSSTTSRPKRAIVLGKDTPETHTAQWMAEGKQMSAATPKDIAKAPPGAARLSVKRYAFDGNSMRWAKLAKGGKTNATTPTRTDTLIYVTKGRMRRTEGNETFDVTAGDAVREMLNTPGSWEILEDSEFVATDAHVLPAIYSPDMVATGSGTKLFAMINDENGRSHIGFADMPMKKVSETEFLSEKQPGLNWHIGLRTGISPYARTSKSYTSATGPYEQHTGGLPHFTGCMAGHIETTLQDGGVLRRSAGEFCYITPGALHHSNFRSDVTAVYFNLFVPGTDEDTKSPVFK